MTEKTTLSRDASIRLVEAAPDLLSLAYQYQNDMRYPVTDSGSVARRLAAINEVLEKVGN